MISALPAFLITLNEGVGDPQLMAGAVSENLVSWWLFILPMGLLAYPLRFFVNRKFRYSGVVVFLCLSALAFILMPNVDPIGGRIVAIGTFVLVAITVPSKILAK